MSHKSVPQECPIRVSHKSVLQECPTRVSYKSDPQECPTRVSYKSVPEECPTRVSYKSVVWTYAVFRTYLHSGSWVPSCLRKSPLDNFLKKGSGFYTAEVIVSSADLRSWGFHLRMTKDSWVVAFKPGLQNVSVEPALIHCFPRNESLPGMIPRNAIVELMRNEEIVVDCPSTVNPFKRDGRNGLLQSWPGFLNCRLISIEEPFSAAERAYGNSRTPIRV